MESVGIIGANVWYNLTESGISIIDRSMTASKPIPLSANAEVSVLPRSSPEMSIGS